nr:FISUMP domain-containing protein [Bacteroidales bacterium]
AGVFAQTGTIENLEVAQRTDGSGLVDIHFDLNGTGASYNLQFEASFDDGASYEPLSETFLNGELSNVMPGAGKHIIWAGKASHPETFSTQTKVRVIAIEYFPPTVPTVITAEVTAITSTSAISGGDVTDDGGAPVTARGVVWSTTPNPTLEINQGFTEDGEGLGDFISEIFDLYRGSSYYLRAYAKNIIGIGYGEEVIFQSISYVSCPGLPTFTDQRDGKIYNTVLIGSQCWMAENLAYLPNVSPSSQGSSSTPYYYVYGYQGTDVDAAKTTDNYYNYGVLYNKPASLTSCPEGWSLPKDSSWLTLVNTIGGRLHNGFKLKSCRQSGSPYGEECNTNEHPRWDSYNIWGNDEFGFNAFPGGCRDNLSGAFSGLGSGGFWWGSTQLFRLTTSGHADIISSYSSGGYSIRCIKNDSLIPTLPSVITVSVGDISSNSAIVNGSVVINGGIPIIVRGFVWDTKPNPTLDENEGVTENGNIVGEFSTLIIISSNTTFYVRAYATNIVGTAYGDDLKFKSTSINPCEGMPTVTDVDGNIYNTVQIGNQCWMAENLRTTKYRNGVPIEYPGENNSAWANDTAGAYSWYNNDTLMKELYGALYNNYVYFNYNAICPLGWRVPHYYYNDPTLQDFTILANYVSGGAESGGRLLKSCRQDNSPMGMGCNTNKEPKWKEDESFFGIDYYGFSALPAGIRNQDGSFHSLNEEFMVYNRYSNIGTANVAVLNYNSDEIIHAANIFNKNLGVTIRCIRENPNANVPWVSTLNLTQITQTSVETGCYASQENSPIISVGLVWNVNPEPTIYNNIGLKSFTPDPYYCCYTHSIENLQPSTTYYVRAFAVNAMGTAYGSELSFMTLAPDWQCGDLLIDARDGQEYTTVQIGDQCWMTKNLNIGTMISGNQEMVDNGTIEKYCYDNSEANCNAYGGQYQWDESMDYSTNSGIKGICPDGWHIPTDLEWTALTTHVSSQPAYHCNSNTSYIAKALAAKTNWTPSLTTCAVGNNLNANDAANFTTLPCGVRHPNGSFINMSLYGFFWSSSQFDTTDAWYRTLYYGDAQVIRYSGEKLHGLSLRCIKDN